MSLNSVSNPNKIVLKVSSLRSFSPLLRLPADTIDGDSPLPALLARVLPHQCVSKAPTP